MSTKQVTSYDELEQKNPNGYAISKVITTVQGHVAEEAFYDSEGNLVGYFAYGYYDPTLPFQGDKEKVIR